MRSHRMFSSSICATKTRSAGRRKWFPERDVSRPVISSGTSIRCQATRKSSCTVRDRARPPAPVWRACSSIAASSGCGRFGADSVHGSWPACPRSPPDSQAIFEIAYTSRDTELSVTPGVRRLSATISETGDTHVFHHVEFADGRPVFIIPAKWASNTASNVSDTCDRDRESENESAAVGRRARVGQVRPAILGGRHSCRG